MDDNTKKLYYCYQLITAGVVFMISAFVASRSPSMAFWVLIVGGIISVPVSWIAVLLGNAIPEIGVRLLFGSLPDPKSREAVLLSDDLHKAERLIREGKPSVALEILNWLLAKNPENFEIRFRTATVYESMGYPGMALKHYRALSCGIDNSAPKNAYVLESRRAVQRILEESKSVSYY